MKNRISQNHMCTANYIEDNFLISSLQHINRDKKCDFFAIVVLVVVVMMAKMLIMHWKVRKSIKNTRETLLFKAVNILENIQIISI